MHRLRDQRLRRRGDRQARAELAARYMPLARTLALRYRASHEPLDDLIQVASVGLVKAIDRWDPDRGTAFATFAVPTILGELRRYFRDCTWAVKPPRATQELSLHVTRARDRLWATLGREPTVAELAAALDNNHERVLDALQAAAAQDAHPLDAPLADGGEEGATFLDHLGEVDPAYGAVEDQLLTQDLINRLDRRAREVLRLRYDQDLLQWEIADRVGVSQMQVSRILRDALDTLQRHATGLTPAAARPAAA
jgi:RNA polymerase sigma-B factor